MATTAYRTTVFIDSNVVLEARPFKDLPWQDIDPIGPILVLLAPTLLREVDSKKRDGRLAVRARDFNRLISTLASGGPSITVAAGPPQVDIALAHCKKIDWDAYDDLDPGQGDDRLVAEILNAKGLSGDGILVSQDLNPLFTAQRHGLKTIHVSSAWLPVQEPSPQQKEISRLKQQIAELQKGEPTFDVLVTVPGQPIPTYQVSALSPQEALLFTDQLLASNPKPEQDNRFGIGTRFGMGFDYDASLDERYSKYAEKTIPAFVANYNRGIELLFNQAPFSLIIENTGKTLAANLLVEIEIVGGWLNEKPIVFNTAGPNAPRPEPSYLRNHIPDFRAFRGRDEPGRHEIVLSDTSRAERLTVQCEDFRQGQKWEFEGVLWIDPKQAKTLVKVKITAANYSNDATLPHEIAKTVTAVTVSDLVELSKPSLKKQPVIRPLIEAALARDEYFGVEWTIGVEIDD
jgi:hypothetical protein